MGDLFVLYEHATGYSLFRVKEMEEIGLHIPAVEQSITAFGKFASIVHFKSFLPFKNAQNALDNMNAISEGIVHEDLSTFLENNLPSHGKKYILGVADSKIGIALNECMGIQCQNSGVIPEIMRGIRTHFVKLVPGFTPDSASKAQLGLGHSYSRAKLKFNVHRADNMIIQSIALSDQMDKDINTFSMRIREWYSFHFPELYKIVNDNYTYARLTNFIKDRRTLNEESLEPLEELTGDPLKALDILKASRSSMGMEISELDLLNIECFSKRVISLVDYKRKLQAYLKNKMTVVAPTLSVITGEQVGARLISRAGSLTNLAKSPASTIQVLGAEKALFRAIKTRGKTPKYGVIYHSSFIAKAQGKNKGRISRFLANKCAIASRIDCFSEGTTQVFGNKMKEQIEERMKFYETGDIPRKNVDVMREAIEEAQIEEKKAKKRRKKEKRESMQNESLNGNSHRNDDEGESPKKKKKKSNNDVSLVDETAGGEGLEIKKKKKRKLADESVMDESTLADMSQDLDGSVTKKKKKKKSKHADD